MITPRQTVTATIEEAGVVAVIRLQQPDRVRAVIDALADGGVRALEVTMTVPGATELIRGLSSTLSSDFLLGAGTVLDPQTAARVIDAGARFVVSLPLEPSPALAADAYRVEPPRPKEPR